MLVARDISLCLTLKFIVKEYPDKTKTKQQFSLNILFSNLIMSENLGLYRQIPVKLDQESLKMISAN